jgi:hypothetical protein
MALLFGVSSIDWYECPARCQPWSLFQKPWVLTFGDFADLTGGSNGCGWSSTDSPPYYTNHAEKDPGLCHAEPISCCLTTTLDYPASHVVPPLSGLFYVPVLTLGVIRL